VDYAIQNGCNLSRAKIATFKHNDMEDLERVIKSEVDMHNALKYTAAPSHAQRP
jgi:7-keto-8-aminopelargonate synthetase-like enzyme